jgi:hypothetical protein
MTTARTIDLDTFQASARDLIERMLAVTGNQ